MLKIEQAYLGDGVYVREGNYPGEIILYTSDGIDETNHIFIDESMADTLIRFRNILQAKYQREKE